MNNNRTKRIVIADDHAIVRQGVKNILSQIPHTEIVCEAENGLEAIAAIKIEKPDLLVVDAAMPLAKGIEVLAECQRWSPKTKIVLFTGFTSANILSQWLASDVDCILLKSCEPEEMREAFEITLSDGRYISPVVEDILAQTPNAVELTQRETEVLSLLASGHANQSIADR